MKKLSLILLFMALFLCMRNNQKDISLAANSEDNNGITENTDIENIDLNEYDINMPKVMYVNSKEGLRKRSEPSVNSNIIGILLYGERTIILERSQSMATIDGINDYWYRTYGYWGDRFYQWGWIFGGYLSENLPSDVPVILGLWETEENIRHIFLFLPNYVYREGFKGSEWFRSGKWELNDDTLILITEYSRYEKLDNPEIEEVHISINDRDNIILAFSDENLEKLIRSNDRYVQY